MLNTEMKVGLVVILSILGLAWMTYHSGSISGFGQQASYRILVTETDNASGLYAGSKVKIAGIDVGQISDIKLTNYGTALIELSINEGTPLADNVFAQIDSDGLIGAKFITISSSMHSDKELPANVMKIPFYGTTSIEDIGAKFSDIATDLGAISKSLREALAGENQIKLKRIVDNVDSISNRLNDIFNNELEEGKINNIANNLSDFSDNLSANSKEILESVRGASASLERILGNNEQTTGELITNFNIVAKNLANITNTLQTKNSTLGRLIHEDSEIVENLEQASYDIATVTNKIASGEGSLGKLINDESTVEKIESALDSLSGLAERVERIQTEIDFYGYALLDGGVSKGRFDVTIAPRPNRFYLLGITSDGYAVEAEDPRGDLDYRGEDYGNKVKFTAQFGHVYENALFNKDLALRFGIRDSAFGVGLDSMLTDNFKASADIYDFSGKNSGQYDGPAHLDLTGRYFFNDFPVYGMFGVDNLLNSDLVTPFVGLGLKFNDDDFKYLLQTVPTGGF